MRLSLLIGNVLVSVCLLTNAPDTLAAYNRHKIIKSMHANKHHKSVRQVKKKHIEPSDIWARIRLGMQIPRPSLATVQAEQSPNLTSASMSQSSLDVNANALAEANQLLQSAELAIKKPDAIADTTPPINHYPPLKYKLTADKHLQPIKAGAKSDRYAQLRQHNVHLPSSSEQLAQHIATISAQTEQPQSALTNAIKPQSSCGTIKPLTPVVTQDQPRPSSMPNSEANAQCGATEAFKYERVSLFINWYKQHNGYLNQVTERAKPYLYHIVDGLNQKKLPLDLALLPIVESAYQPTALSPKSAAGLWQFMPATGNDFELGQTSYYDDRLDITASTRAATQFLSRLKQHFNGDWLLALAAYNCGQGTVDEAINQNKINGLATDFWSLALPEETRDYVPRLLALASIFANPEEHGIKIGKINDEPYFVKINIQHATDINHLAGKRLETVAQLANVSYDTFAQLNPGFITATLPAEGPFTFLVPITHAKQLHQSLNALTRVVTTMLQTEDSLAAQISALVATKQAKYTTPFLSLEMTEKAALPRIATDYSVSTL